MHLPWLPNPLGPGTTCKERPEKVVVLSSIDVNYTTPDTCYSNGLWYGQHIHPLTKHLAFVLPWCLNAIQIVHPPFCGITAHATWFNFCFHALIQVKGVWKIVSLLRGRWVKPTTFQSRALCLTTRPRFLALIFECLQIHN